jgi:hypothetical protein
VAIISAILVARVEPFKSHLPLAILLAAGVGLLFTAIEVGVRKLVLRLRGKSSAINAAG